MRPSHATGAALALAFASGALAYPHHRDLVVLATHPAKALEATVLHAATDDPERRVAPEILALLGELDAVPAIAKTALVDPDPDLRAHALTALGTLVDTVRAGHPLAPGETTHDYGAVCRVLARAVRDDPVPAVRAAAARALAFAGHTPSSARAALKKMAAGADAAAAADAVLALAALRAPRVGVRDLVLSFFHDPRPVVRAAVSVGLARLGMYNHDVRSHLEACLRDEDPAVRRIAFQSLHFVEGPMVVSGLWRALGDEDAGVRAQAAALLAFHGPEAKLAAPRLARVLHHDPSEEVRLAAVRALTQVSGAGAILELRRALRNRYPSVALAAGVSLRRLGRSGMAALHDHLTGAVD